MKKWLKITCTVLASLVVLAGAGFGAWQYWLYQQPKFHDLTVELGTESISLRQFMTEFARDNKVHFVTDPGSVDLNHTSTVQLKLRHGRQEQTVVLTVEDTTAPKAQFVERVVVYANQEVPQAEQLVTEVFDLAPYTIAYLQEPKFPQDYRDQAVTILVTDESGNQTSGSCTLSFRWMLESYQMELGQILDKETVLLNPQRDVELLDQAQLDAINQGGVGSYTLTSLDGSASCAVTVVDTTPPALELRSVERLVGRKATLEDFVVSATDLSGIKEVRLMTELSFNKEKTYTVVIEAEDNNGNITTGETTLAVVPDRVPPSFGGNLKSMSVKKNSNPDFLSGVKAYDEVSGSCTVKCDTSQLDLTKTGTYYITYSATDASGNTGRYRRKVTVEHDAADTAALVKSIASGLGNDPVAIKNYVRDKIYYSHDWGGDDPVWFGFQNRKGNCYVHAKCLQKLLQAKGYRVEVIHTTCKTHYWLIIQYNGKWYHIDATPGRSHQRYDLMNDAQREETLSGRDWDRDKWPPCG